MFFKRRKKVKADVGNYVKAQTRQGEVNGVLVPFRGKEWVETKSGIRDIQEVTGVTPTQNLGDETMYFVKTVRRRHGLQ
jgi:hypothetical protein